eukprot:121203-Prymnesium_polylepis.1
MIADQATAAVQQICVLLFVRLVCMVITAVAAKVGPFEEQPAASAPQGGEDGANRGHEHRLSCTLPSAKQEEDHERIERHRVEQGVHVLG